MTIVTVLSTERRRIVNWLLLQVAVHGLLMAQSSEGSMFRADLLRDGNYQTEGPTHASSKWKFKTGRVVEAWFSSPTVVNRVDISGTASPWINCTGCPLRRSGYTLIDDEQFSADCARGTMRFSIVSNLVAHSRSQCDLSAVS